LVITEIAKVAEREDAAVLMPDAIDIVFFGNEKIFKKSL